MLFQKKLARLEKCWGDGTDSSQNKTPPIKYRGRNEESCEQGRRVVVVPVIVKPVVVPIPRTIVTEVQITDIEVAVGVAKSIKRLLLHHPLNTLWVVFYL